jgi:hypothetical protein
MNSKGGSLRVVKGKKEIKRIERKRRSKQRGNETYRTPNNESLSSYRSCAYTVTHLKRKLDWAHYLIIFGL